MRIVLVGPTPPLLGGVVAHTEGARKALARRGHDVEIVPFARIFPRWLIGRSDERRQDGTRSAALDTLAPRSWGIVAGAISADVLLVQHWTPAAAPALRAILTRARVARRVLVCHNAQPHERVPGGRWLTKALVQASDAVIFHSEHVASSLRKDVDRLARRTTPCSLRAAVVPMPLLTSAGATGYPPGELGRLTCDDAPFVALVGHLRRYKGLASLASAWPTVAGARHVRLVVAGEPLGARRVLRRLKDLAELGFPITVIDRYVDDGELLWLLARAQAVVLPYTSATQSAVLPLALRLARHVVVSDAGALPEQMASSARAATLVPAGNPEALARALDAVLAEAAAETVRAMRQPEKLDISTAEVATSWEPFAEAVESLGAPNLGGYSSNSGGRGPSLLRHGADDEPAGEPWYHARRFPSPGFEAPDK